MFDQQKLLIKTQVKVALGHCGGVPVSSSGNALGRTGTRSLGTTDPGGSRAVPKGKVRGDSWLPAAAGTAQPAGSPALEASETQNKMLRVPLGGPRAGPGILAVRRWALPPRHPLDDKSGEPQVSPCPLLTGLDLPATPFDEHLDNQFNLISVCFGVAQVSLFGVTQNPVPPLSGSD